MSCTGSSPTWTATPDRASVNTCVTSASSGDTVNVLAGTSSWGGVNEVVATKAIHIIGAGTINSTAGTSAATTITCATGVIPGCFSFQPTSGEETKVFEVAGFNFIGNSALDETNWGHTPAITSLKVHNNNFTNASTGRAVFLGGLEWGVFYLNSFSGDFISVSVIDVSAPNPGATGAFQPFAFGASTYPYFEDNLFGDGAGGEFVTETGQGGRMVFRHNTVNGYNGGGGSGAELFDIHGEQGSGGWTVTEEIYHNTIINTGTQPFRWINHRGGQMVIMNNTVDKQMDMRFTELLGNAPFSCGATYPVGCTAAEVLCSPPNGTTCRICQVNNSYYFNNLVAGLQQTPSFQDPGVSSVCGGQFESTYIQQNRDYWLPTFGLESALPATCTANGNTFYGTTDTDKIFKCTSTNTWTNFFTPYTYPHPLRGGSTLTPPTNLVVTSEVSR